VKKTKALVTSMVLITSLSTGTVFAVSDAGKQLQKWYQGRFKTVTKSITKNTIDPRVDDMFERIDDLQEFLISDAKEKLQKAEAGTSFNSVSILQYNNKYINQISTKKNQLTKKGGIIAKDFDNYIGQQNEGFDKTIDDSVNEFFTDLNVSLDNEVSASKEVMESGSRNAQEELAKTISNSKEHITSNISTYQRKALNSIKDNMDSNITESKKNVEENTQVLVDGQAKSLQSTGSELENQAKEQLINIIEKIN